MTRAFYFLVAVAAFAASLSAMATATAAAGGRVHGGRDSLSAEDSQTNVLVLADLSSFARQSKLAFHVALFGD